MVGFSSNSPTVVKEMCNVVWCPSISSWPQKECRKGSQPQGQLRKGKCWRGDAVQAPSSPSNSRGGRPSSPYNPRVPLPPTSPQLPWSQREGNPQAPAQREWSLSFSPLTTWSPTQARKGSARDPLPKAFLLLLREVPPMEGNERTL